MEHLEEAVKQSSLIEFPPQRTQTRAGISARFAQLGMLPRALADDLSAEAPQQVRETVAAKLGRSGQPEKALALYPGPDTPPDAVLLAVVPALLGQGRMETARQLIDSVTSPENRIPLLIRLAEEPDQDGHKRLTAALNAINLMVSNTSTMSDSDLTARVARCLHTVAGTRSAAAHRRPVAHHQVRHRTCHANPSGCPASFHGHGTQNHLGSYLGRRVSQATHNLRIQ